MSKTTYNRINHHHHHNNSTSPTTTTTTPPTALITTLTSVACAPITHRGEYGRRSSTSSSSPTSIPHYLHNSSYGLLEPAATTKTAIRHHPHHRRKYSISTGLSTWSDRTFDLAGLKNRSFGLGGKISEKLPGVRYSATSAPKLLPFISTLRTNLVLATSLAPPSPNLLAFSPGLLPSHLPFNDSFLTTPPRSREMVIEKETGPLEGIPDLIFSRPHNQDDKTAGLKLVADVLSQQRSTTSKTLIYNPLTVLLWAVLVGLMYPFVYRNPATDKPNLAIAVMGISMSILAGVRYVVKPYQDLAEAINWAWLGEDEMAIAKFGDAVVGSCVYRVPDSSKKSSNSKELLIRAWTTRPRERRKGVGRGLLEYVVDVAKQKGCSGVDFAPAELRVGSTRLLTQLDGFAGIVHVNKVYDKEEAKARTMLRTVLDERWSERRSRGSR